MMLEHFPFVDCTMRKDAYEQKIHTVLPYILKFVPAAQETLMVGSVTFEGVVWDQICQVVAELAHVPVPPIPNTYLQNKRTVS